MNDRRPYDIDMRADGSFVEAARQHHYSATPPPRRAGVMSRTLAIAAVMAGAVIVAGVALSLALVLVPVMIGAALLGYGALRFQLWRMRQNGGAPAAGAFAPIMAQIDALLRARRQGR